MSIKTSRRSLIAGTAAAAVLATVPASAATGQPDRSDWELALARVDAADRAHREFCANVFDPAFAAERAFEASQGVTHKLPNGDWSQTYFHDRNALQARLGTDYLVPDHVHEKVEALGEAFVAAEDAALQTPAPDLAALRWKLDRVLQLEHTGDESGACTAAWSASYVQQTLADITRLLPEGR